MRIGIPRERKTLEKRVALTPDGAAQLIKHGHTVFVEVGAGEAVDFSDDEYRTMGCTMASSLEEVWANSELLVKVKEPHESEYQYFRPDLTVFSFLHLAGLPEVAKVMLDSKVTGIAYELVQTEDGRLPLLEPMSEIAGKLSVLNGSYYLLSQNQGRGMLLGGALGVARAQVTIVGAGISGRAACEVAYGMGADVTILDIDIRKLEMVKSQFGNQVSAVFSTPPAIARAAAESSLLIGAVLVPGAAAPKVISREMIESMPKGSVFVDISMDQGGCAETSRATSLDDPVFELDGVTHYGVCNMPSQAARTATMALTSATLPYVLQLANLGCREALQASPRLKVALNTMAGKLTNLEVAKSLKLDFTEAEVALIQ